MPNRLNGQMNKAIEEQSKFNIKIRQSVEKEIFVWFIYVRSAISDDNCIVLYCIVLYEIVINPTDHQTKKFLRDINPHYIYISSFVLSYNIV